MSIIDKLEKEEELHDPSIPPGRLEMALSNGYFSPEKLRELIDNKFPGKGKNMFSGIEYMCFEGRTFCSKTGFRKLWETLDSKDKVLAKVIPIYEEVGEGFLMVVESEIHKSENYFHRYFQWHIVLGLTEEGYRVNRAFTIYADPISLKTPSN